MYSIVFYGAHCSTWDKAFTRPSLMEKLNVKSIKVIHNLRDLKSVSYDFLIPLMEIHMEELHTSGIKASMSSIESIRTFGCKKKFSEFIKENNLGEFAPLTYDKNSNFDIAISKPFNLNFGNGCKIVHKNDPTIWNKHVIVQEFLKSDKEYVAHVVASNGIIKFCVVYCYQMDEELYIKSQSKLPLKTFKVDHLVSDLEVFEKFLKPGSYNGVCNFNYKIIDGTIKVMEINPRFGGSILEERNVGDLASAIQCFIKNLS